MSARILRLGQLSQRERAVLMLMRGDPEPWTARAMATAFATLSRAAARAELIVSTPANPIVHCDEKKLLAWLTLLQRQSTSPATAWDFPHGEALLQPLRECARLLDRAALRLDYRNAVRFLNGVQACHEWRELPHEEASAWPRAASACLPFGSSLHRRVLSLVAEKGAIATHDLNAAGASSHVIGTMRKRGLLRRIRHGLYALGQPALATADKGLSHA